MTIIYNNTQYGINGVISTNKTVWQNLDSLAVATNCFITFDINQGKWAVIINKPGSSVASFNDSNIIGGITVSGTGLTSFYNQVQVSFPHKDLLGSTDTVIATLDSSQWYPNEVTNILNIQCDIINDPVQAEVIASTQLKQSRVDTVISFQTDYTHIGVKAGDLISITNTPYNFAASLFRVTSIEEVDNTNGSINLNITALAYDTGVYDYTNVSRQVRSPVTGITVKTANAAIQQSNANSLGPLLALLGATQLFKLIFPSLNKKLVEALNTPNVTITANKTDACEGQSVTITVTVCCTSCQDLNAVVIPYTITGVPQSLINVPLKGNITVNSQGVGTIVVSINSNSTTDGNRTMVFTAGNSSKNIIIHDPKNVTLSASPSTIQAGNSTTVTFTTTGIADGTTKNYTITGDTGMVSSPALTGTVTVNSNTATLTINTNSSTTANQQITVTFDPGTFYCTGNLINIPITGSGTPPDPVVSTCTPISIPIAWCPNFAANGKVISLTATAFAWVTPATSGGVLVPMTVGVTTGTTSTVTVTTTARVNNSSTLGGQTFNVLTSFNGIPVNGNVTGSATTIIGYV